MEDILNQLCIKRLCLPSNININDLRNGVIKTCTCKNNFTKHIACTFNDDHILSYGFNNYNNPNDDRTIHAEVSSILNLPPLINTKKNLKKINILVIKTSITGKIGSSKPCINCIKTMTFLPQKRGYIIKKILYSDVNGVIINISLNRLISNGNFHIPKYDQ